jgi:hypothetical protein
MAPSEVSMLRAVEPLAFDGCVDEVEEGRPWTERTPGPRSLAAWVIIQAARDAMTDWAPTTKVSNAEVGDAVSFWRDRDYEGYARAAGISLSVLECMRTLVLARHGATVVHARA